MKKNKLFIGISMCTLMLAVGCSKNGELQPSEEGILINVKSTVAAIGNNSTRATLAADEKTPNWEANDKIAAIVDNGSATELSLLEGEGTANGTFTGTIPFKGAKMYFYYPAAAATTVDLTAQDGSNIKEMVMFASSNYSTKPNVTFNNKTSIIKTNIPFSKGCTWTKSTTGISAIVLGAYSKGKLTKEGNWTDLEKADIRVSNIKITNDYKICGYAALIPGSKVTDLRIVVFKGNEGYVTYNYTNTDADIPENNVVTINRATEKAMIWTPATTKAVDVNNFLGTDGNELMIVGTSQMESADFNELIEGLKDKSSINLTLLNQTTLPSSALGNCTNFQKIYAPNLTTIGKYALKRCSATDVSLPNLKAFNVQMLFGVSALKRACFTSLTDFTNANQEISAKNIELAFGATEKFTFAEGKNPLVIFQDDNTMNMSKTIAASTTLYLNQDGYEYKNEVKGNTWRGVTFKEIKTFASFTGTANGWNPPSMGYLDN